MHKQLLSMNILKSISPGLILTVTLLCILEIVPRFKVAAENIASISNICPNGGFESGSECWTIGGVLPTFIQSEEKLVGNYAALLGDPDHTKCPGRLPIGEAWIRQRFLVPDNGAPYLSFAYRLISYDELKYDGPLGERYDHFDVYIDDVSDSLPPFRIFRDGSTDGKPTSDQDGCTLTAEDKGWITRTWTLSSVVNFDDELQIYDLRGKTIDLIFINLSRDAPGYNQAWYNTWVYIDNVKLQRSLALEKTTDPPGPFHEGDTITYNIAYANTGLTTQTMTITDPLPFNAALIPGTISPPGTLEGSTIVWNLDDIPPDGADQVSFQVRVPLLPNLDLQTLSHPLMTLQGEPYIIPNAIQCDSTRFWMVGLLPSSGPGPTPTPQPCDDCESPDDTKVMSTETQNPSPLSTPYTMHIEIPSNSSPSTAWLLMREEASINTGPTVDNQATTLVTKTVSIPGASVWAAALTQAMINTGSIQVTTEHPDQLDAILLFEGQLPPFDLQAMKETSTGSYFQTYTFDVPSVTEGELNVLYPILDVIAQAQQMTTMTVEFNGTAVVKKFTQPNMNDGLAFISFPFDLHEFDDQVVKNLPLNISLETEDNFVWSLGPRVCRPVYIENTAWLCSLQAGCISDTVQNVPGNYSPPFHIYLPAILKSSP